jgi:hypothetical protein
LDDTEVYTRSAYLKELSTQVKSICPLNQFKLTQLDRLQTNRHSHMRR